MMRRRILRVTLEVMRRMTTNDEINNAHESTYAAVLSTVTRLFYAHYDTTSVLSSARLLGQVFHVFKSGEV